MSQSPYYPQGAPVRQEPTNTVGLIGLIISIVGFTGCLIAAPIGLIVSLFGLRHPQKGFAIGGAVVGGIGTLVLLVIVILYGAMIAACIGIGTAVQPYGTTSTKIQEAKQAIDDYQTINDKLPDEQTGNDLIGGINDGWENQLRYEPSEDGSEYTIRSAGRDGIFDTNDDQTSDDLDYEYDMDTEFDSMGDEPFDSTDDSTSDSADMSGFEVDLPAESKSNPDSDPEQVVP